MPALDDWVSDFFDQIPIYTQIIDQFKARAASGSLPHGERLPSIRDLAVRLRVNPNTVMRAYQELERDGLIKSQRGLGYFVSDEGVFDAMRRDMALKATERYTVSMRHLGMDDARILETLGDYLKERGHENE